MVFITSLCGDGFYFIASGELGKYIVTVRKKDVNWYVGGMTNWDSDGCGAGFLFPAGRGPLYGYAVC